IRQLAGYDAGPGGLLGCRIADRGETGCRPPGSGVGPVIVLLSLDRVAAQDASADQAKQQLPAHVRVDDEAVDRGRTSEQASEQVEVGLRGGDRNQRVGEGELLVRARL